MQERDRNVLISSTEVGRWQGKPGVKQGFMTGPQRRPTYKGGQRGCSLHLRMRAKTSVLETEIRGVPEEVWVGEDFIINGVIEEGKGPRGPWVGQVGVIVGDGGHGLSSQS